ncbi:hypothetical protein CUMW_084110 [Citrus unshiu]|nr:hypothetical protein CUMW_084110 [Citrus unshiu]
MASEDASPSLDILVREPEGFFVWNGPPFSNGQPTVKLERVPCTNVRFSGDGSRLMVMKSDSVISIYDCDNFKEIRSFQVPDVAAADLSPCGTYLQTFQKSSTPQEKNVILWETDTAIPEEYDKNHMGSPASVQIYACGKDLQSQPLARRSFFRCSTVQLNWNLGSTGLLAVAQSDVDKTNQSYYGESKLNYLTTDGTHEGLVPLRKEGPVHDVQWSYSGSEFAVLCLQVQQFLTRSAGRYSSLVVALTILSGGTQKENAFWDYVDGKQLGTTRAECSVTSEWSPDGRYFMTATTAPRLQIDNGIKIFHHNGSLFFKKMFDKLFQAEWKPVSPDKFGDISELIKSVGSLKVAETKSQGSGSASRKAAPSNPTATKPAAYRPPHAKQAAAIQAELLGESPTPEMSKNALRNKKKREKQKEKKAAEAAAEGI